MFLMSAFCFPGLGGTGLTHPCSHRTHRMHHPCGCWWSPSGLVGLFWFFLHVGLSLCVKRWRQPSQIVTKSPQKRCGEFHQQLITSQTRPLISKTNIIKTKLGQCSRTVIHSDNQFFKAPNSNLVSADQVSQLTSIQPIVEDVDTLRVQRSYTHLLV